MSIQLIILFSLIIICCFAFLLSRGKIKPGNKKQIVCQLSLRNTCSCGGGRGTVLGNHVSHFTPFPFPRVHKIFIACMCTSSLWDWNQVEKTEAVLSSAIVFCLCSVVSSKVQEKLCMWQFSSDPAGHSIVATRRKIWVKIWIDSFPQCREMTKL